MIAFLYLMKNGLALTLSSLTLKDTGSKFTTVISCFVLLLQTRTFLKYSIWTCLQWFSLENLTFSEERYFGICLNFFSVISRLFFLSHCSFLFGLCKYLKFTNLLRNRQQLIIPRILSYMSRTLYCQKQVVCAASFSSAFLYDLEKKDSFGRTVTSVRFYFLFQLIFGIFFDTRRLLTFSLFIFISTDKFLCVFQLISVYLGSRYILQS